MTTLAVMSSAAPPSDPKPSWRPATFRALRHRNYLLYFLGQIVSLTGSWVQTSVLMWLVWELTDQEFWPPLLSAAGVIPILLLGVPGGGLADRWPRRPLIFLAQSALLLLSLALAGLVLTGVTTPDARPTGDLVAPMCLLAVSLLIGVANAIDTPARLAFVIDMVGRDDLLNAVALNSLVFNVARMVGPALGGLLLPILGYSVCFLLNAASFAAILAALLAMRLPPATQIRDPKHTTTTIGALRYLAKQRGLILLLLMAGSLAFFGWPLLPLLPAVSDRMLQSGNVGYAWMTSAVGGGALVGALAVASFCTQLRRPLFLVMGVLTGILSLAGLALTTNLPAAVGWCALSGFGLILFFATGQATMQLGADEHNRGRILGIWLAILSGAQPLGNLTSGWLAHLWGVGAVLMFDAAGIMFVAVVVGVLAFWWKSPSG